MQNLLQKETGRYEAKNNEKLTEKTENEEFITLTYKNKKTEAGKKRTILKYSKDFDFLIVVTHYPDNLPHKAYTVAVELVTDNGRKLVAQY